MQSHRIGILLASLLLFTVVAAVASTALVTATTATTVSSESVAANPGDTSVSIPIKISGLSSEGLGNITLHVVYDKSVIDITGNDQPNVGDYTYNSNPNATPPNSQSKKMLVLVAYSGSGPKLAGDFVVVNLKANVVGSPGATTSLTLTVAEFTDATLLTDDVTGFSVSSGTFTINTPPSVSISPSTVAVNEGNSGTTAVNLTLSLSATTSGNVIVGYSTSDGTATVSDSDYGSVTSGSATITAGNSTTTISVNVNGDTKFENDETFNVNLTSATNGTLNTSATTTVVTITNDDSQPTVSIVPTAKSVLEGDSGTTAVTLNAELSAASGFDTVVSFVINDGSATLADSDYFVSATSGTVSISSGQTTSGAITVTVIGDATSENDENLTVVLTGATSNAQSLTIVAATSTVTILADEGPEVSLDPSSRTVAEGGSTSITVKISETSPDPVIVVVATRDGSATAGENDYTPSTTTVTIAPGALSGSVTVGALDDVFDENPESYLLIIVSATGTKIRTSTTKNTSTINIIDTDNVPTVSIDTPVSVTEGNSGTINAVLTVRLNTVSGRDVTAVLRTKDGTATVSDSDYQAVTGLNVTILKGQTSATTSVAVIGDLRNEINETFTVEIDSTITGSETAIISTTASSAQVTVTNDDALPVLSILDATIIEGNSGASNVTLTVQIDAVSGQQVSAQVSTANGTATAGPDYIAVSGTTVTIPAGSTSTTVTITIIGDTDVEVPDETFAVSLSSVTNATISSTQGTATVTIQDDEQRTIFITDLTVDEGVGTAKVVVTITPASTAQTTIKYTTQDGTANSSDYTGVGTATGTVIIATSATSTTIMVPIIDDNVDEPSQIFTVQISDPVSATVGLPLVISTSTATVTITDNDDTPTIHVADASVLEGATATISLIQNRPSEFVVTVQYSTENGTATAGSDYNSASATATISVLSTSTTIWVKTLDDAIEEDGETVIIRLSNSVNATIGTTTGTLLITDDEPVAAIVTIMADGEVMPGDGYFLIVAAPNSPALGLSGVTGVQLTSPNNQTLMPIANVSEVIRKMLGLDTLRTKAVTHAWYAIAATSTGQQSIQYNATLSYGSSKTHNVSATLNVVTARTNRNIWIQDGVNFAGLALVPNDTSITNLLKQRVWNANPALGGALSRPVTLADVIQSIFAFSFTNNAFFSSYNTADPISGADAADTFTQLAPFQGMVIRSRDSVTPNNASSINVFETVVVNGASTTVPIKINLQGPYMVTSGNNPLVPVTQQLRIGYNLIAPHVSAPTPFQIAFSGHGASSFDSVYGTALSFQKAVFPVSMSPSMVGATVVAQFVFATADEGSKAMIDPVLSYWLRVAGTAQPTVSASGPNTGGANP